MCVQQSWNINHIVFAITVLASNNCENKTIQIKLVFYRIICFVTE